MVLILRKVFDANPLAAVKAPKVNTDKGFAVMVRVLMPSGTAA
jgi:hypothetical protein